MGTFPAAANAKVRKIAATKGIAAKENIFEVKTKNVAAYARVSTEEEEQQNSYEAQVTYYTEYINNRRDWNLVKVYADEGITGTNMKKRVEFRQMVEDAKSGKIDLIITKSISRFARNTIDTLKTVRDLKELGIEIWFEKENIHTLDPQSEMILTIMSSLAQEESRAISTNVTWGIRKRMEEGQVRFAFSRFLGYRKGPDGRPEIVEEEAETVRKIYRWFLEGKRPNKIKELLEAMHIKSPTGKDTWNKSTILSILRNEKYKGDALLQKTITVDYLSKKVKKNDGELEQYYVEGSHPAIINPDVFDLVQYELRIRAERKVDKWGENLLNGKIRCANCGGCYRHRIHTSRNGTRYDAWSCVNKLKKGEACDAPNIREDLLKDSFIKALKIAILDPVGNTVDEKADMARRSELEEMKQIAEERRIAATEAKDDFLGRSDKTRLSATAEKEYTKLKKAADQAITEYENIKQMIVDETARKMQKQFFIKATEKLDPATLEYSDALMQKTLNLITVEVREEEIYLSFDFTNGVVVPIGIGKRKKPTYKQNVDAEADDFDNLISGRAIC